MYLLCYSKSTENIIAVVYMTCSHCRTNRSGIYGVVSKGMGKIIAVVNLINVLIVDKIDLILTLSLCQWQEHRIDNCFCLYDPCYHRLVLLLSVPREQEKTTVVLYIINFLTLEEIGLI